MLKSIISFAIVSIGFGQHHTPYDAHSTLGSTIGLGSHYGGLGSQFGQRHTPFDTDSQLFGQHANLGYGRQYGYGSQFGQRHTPFDTDSQLFGQHANLGSAYGYGSQFGSQFGQYGGLGGYGQFGGLGQFGGIGQLLSGNTNPLIRNMLVKNLLEQLMDKHITEFNSASADVTAQTIILEKFASEVMHLGLHLSL